MTRPARQSTLNMLDEMRFFARHTSMDLDEFAATVGMKCNSVYAAARHHGRLGDYQALADRRATVGEAVRHGAVRL